MPKVTIGKSWSLSSGLRVGFSTLSESGTYTS